MSERRPIRRTVPMPPMRQQDLGVHRQPFNKKTGWQRGVRGTYGWTCYVWCEKDLKKCGTMAMNTYDRSDKM